MQPINEYLCSYNGERIVMFGASNNASALLGQFEINNILCFCDNDAKKQGEKFKGFDIISADALMGVSEPVYVIISSDSYAVIYHQLRDAGFKGGIDGAPCIRDRRLIAESGGDWRKTVDSEPVQTVCSLLADEKSKETYIEAIKIRLFQSDKLDFSEIKTDEKIYFNENIFALTDNEIYIDGGARGSSSFDFMHAVNGKFDKIYCFEPGLTGYNELCAEYERLNIPKDKYDILNAGIYSETKKAHFSQAANSGYSDFLTEHSPPWHNSVEFAEAEAQLYRLDDIIKGRATLIKMDIEGSELEAIKGAEGIIKDQKPKLAICLYHRITDFWEIPLLIRRICPEYKFYVRHHLNYYWDTVLYAYV